MRFFYASILCLYFGMHTYAFQDISEDYLCKPCNLDCDTIVFKQPGICPHCKMPLIKKALLKKLNQTVYVDDLIINYKFLDEASLHKKDEITEIIKKGFKHYKTLFGGNPRDISNQHYTEFTVQISNTKHSGGEADSKFIKLEWSDDTVLGYGSWKMVLLHEVFHLWNGETLRYKNGSEYWFNEGFTEFYTYQSAVKLNLLSPKKALTTATYPIGYYLSTSSLKHMSMREAGKNDKTKFDNFFLVYHGGWVVALVLDYDIRLKTNNKKSLDNIMQWLYANYPRTTKLYTTKDIIKGLKITTGIDYSDFFNHHVYGKQPIPVSNYFDLGKALWDYLWNPEEKLQHQILYKTLGFSN